jgi:hypothetical protein
VSHTAVVLRVCERDVMAVTGCLDPSIVCHLWMCLASMCFASFMTDASSERLLSNLAQLVTKFVHDVSIKQGLSEKVASEAGGRIYTSGSYR